MGDDAKTKEFPDGTSVGEVSVENRLQRPRQQGWMDGAHRSACGRHAVVMRRAAAAAAAVRKGASVHLTVRLRTRSWDRDGEQRYKTEVVCNASDVIMTWMPGQGHTPPESVPEADGNAGAA